MRCAGGGVCPGVWADCRVLAGTVVPRSGHILLDLSERVLRTRDSQRPEEAVSGQPCSVCLTALVRQVSGCSWVGWAPPFPDAGPPQPLFPVSCPSSSPPS